MPVLVWITYLAFPPPPPLPLPLCGLTFVEVVSVGFRMKMGFWAHTLSDIELIKNRFYAHAECVEMHTIHHALLPSRQLSASPSISLSMLILLVLIFFTFSILAKDCFTWMN